MLEDPPLSLEHVPPKSMGGKAIALTCKGCNTLAGHSIDAALSRRSALTRLYDVLTGASYGEGGRVTFHVGDASLNAQVSRDIHDPVRVEILGRWNDPRKVERVRAYGEEHARGDAWTGGRLRMTAPGYDPQLALAGDLKAAFLAAFAALGYRYAFDPRLVLVRQQILNPLKELIGGWFPLHQTATDRCLVLIPEPLPSVMVRLGWVDVLLPWLNSPLNFYDALAALYQTHGPQEVIGESMPWPTTLEMKLDIE